MRRATLSSTSIERRLEEARQLDLGFERDVESLDTVLLLSAQVVWSVMPCFTSESLQRFAPVSDMLKMTLSRWRNTVKMLEDWVTAAFRALLHEDLDHALEAGAELCVQACQRVVRHAGRSMLSRATRERREGEDEGETRTRTKTRMKVKAGTIVHLLQLDPGGFVA